MKERNRKSLLAWRLLGAAATLVLSCAAPAVAECPFGTSCDPGPRPVGSQSASFAGPVSTAGVPLLPTPVVNTRQPPDANGNEGAGQVIRQAGSVAGFWFRTIARFGQVASVNGATDAATANPTSRGLGPSFNGTSCFMCHAQPAIGGTSARALAPRGSRRILSLP
jgi:hypothetical protein